MLAAVAAAGDAISFSSFFYTATLFNEWQDEAHFYWPNGTSQRFEPYDPWEPHLHTSQQNDVGGCREDDSLPAVIGELCR